MKYASDLDEVQMLHLGMSRLFLLWSLARELSHPPGRVRRSFNLQGFATNFNLPVLRRNDSSLRKFPVHWLQPKCISTYQRLCELGVRASVDFYWSSPLMKCHWISRGLWTKWICLRRSDSKFWKPFGILGDQGDLVISWQITQTGFMWGLLNLSKLAARGSIDAS